MTTLKHLKLNRLATMIAIICLPIVFFSCQKDDPKEKTSEINYHFATIAEGQQLLAANTEYYNSLNQNNIDWRMRRTGSSLDELTSSCQYLSSGFIIIM